MPAKYYVAWIFEEQDLKSNPETQDVFNVLLNHVKFPLILIRKDDIYSIFNEPKKD